MVNAEDLRDIGTDVSVFQTWEYQNRLRFQVLSAKGQFCFPHLPQEHWPSNYGSDCISVVCRR